MHALLCLAWVLSANVYEETFTGANTAYQAGNYAQAIQGYEQLVAEGAEDASVFFNLGNAYLRGGRLGPAIANYERALQLNPRLDSARENLDKAVRDTKRHLERPLPPEWEQSLLFWHYNLGGRTAFVLAAIFWFLFWLLLGLRQWRPLPHTRWTALIVLLLAVAFGLSAWAKAHPEMLAVANDERVPVHYGTNDQETVRFELYAGDRVTVDKRINGWARVTTADGERGWARDKTLTFIGPPYEPPAPPEPAPPPAPEKPKTP